MTLKLKRRKSDFNLLSCKYTIKKIIDYVKTEKKKMKGNYEAWLMIEIKKQ